MSFWRGREGYRQEVESEIQDHLELRARELEEEGMEPEEAWRAAVEAFGDPEAIEREVLEMREHRKNFQPIGERLLALGQDLRYAARFLTRNKIFAAVAVGTLALGIGANTAIFSVADAALLRSPGVDDPESLAAVYTTCRRGAPRCSSSYPDYLDYRDRTRSIADLVATSTQSASLGDAVQGTRLVDMELVTGTYFSLLGVGADLGRVLLPSDDGFRSGAPVAVISEGLWRDWFGGDPQVLGRTLRLNDTPLEVVGVLGSDFQGLTLGDVPDVWVPMQTGAEIQQIPERVWEDRGTRWIGRLVGRLAPGASVEQARAELTALSDAMREENPEARGERTVTVDPLASYLLPQGAEENLPRFVWILLGVVGATLLLACANLANLLMARASARRDEIGVRIALGAGRIRLVRQLLSESALLSTVGGAVGLVVAYGLLRALSVYELPGGITFGALDVGIDGRVLVATAALVVVTTLAFGLVPALQATRGDVSHQVHRGGAAGGRAGGGLLRRGLVAVQVALCFVLLAGSGLFVRTLRSALRADLGFEERSLTIGRANLANLGYSGVETLEFSSTLRERLLASPAVRSAAVANVLPMAGGGFSGTFTSVDGYQPAPDEEMRIDQVYVTPAYFETLGIPILAGRDFDEGDSEEAEEVAIVSRSMAERYWPGGEAVGGYIRPLRPPFGSTPEPIRVVGVVEDVRWRSLDEEPTNFVFFPRAQHPERLGSSTMVVAGTDGEASALVPLIRREAGALEPDLTFSVLTTMNDQIGEELMPQRVGTVLFSAFGLLALVLSAVGIVGVVGYTVREQQRAIGVRMALGAGRGEILGQVLRGMAAPVALGLAAGLAAALALDGAVEQFLYGVSAGDPLTYGAIAGGLAVVALAATLLPAREATRVDPLRVLRAE